MKKQFIVAITLALGATCINSSTAGTVQIKGVQSCGTWVANRSVYERGWILGYLSGIVIFSGVDFLRNTDPESIYLWMDNYCRNNPLKEMGDGGVELAKELARNKGLKF